MLMLMNRNHRTSPSASAKRISDQSWNHLGSLLRCEIYPGGLGFRGHPALIWREHYQVRHASHTILPMVRLFISSKPAYFLSSFPLYFPSDKYSHSFCVFPGFSIHSVIILVSIYVQQEILVYKRRLSPFRRSSLLDENACQRGKVSVREPGYRSTMEPALLCCLLNIHCDFSCSSHHECKQYKKCLSQRLHLRKCSEDQADSEPVGYGRHTRCARNITGSASHILANRSYVETLHTH